MVPTGGNMDMGHMSMNEKRMPWWNFVNATTTDATADGKVGVIIEPDLIPGTIGIDGGEIRKCEMTYIM
jgi:hypothetical protein